MDFDEILCMQYCDQYMKFPELSTELWPLLKFQFFSISLEIMNGF